MYIVIAGDPVDGYEYYGPFETDEAAVLWADNDAHMEQVHWWNVRLAVPD